MNLTPREKDTLLIAMAAIVARRRLERGVKLNHPEAVALITDFVVEGGVFVGEDDLARRRIEAARSRLVEGLDQHFGVLGAVDIEAAHGFLTLGLERELDRPAAGAGIIDAFQSLDRQHATLLTLTRCAAAHGQ